MNVYLTCGSTAYVCASFANMNEVGILRRLDFDNVRFAPSQTFEVYPTFDDPVSDGVMTDFPYTDICSALVMSGAAANALQDLLLPSGPLCDTIGPGFKDYKLFACFQQLDALDLAVAEFHTCDPRDPFVIKRYGFKPEVIDGIDMFTTKPLAGSLFVSDRFKERVTSAGLTGLRFQPLWSREKGSLHEFEYHGADFKPDPDTAGMSLAQKRERMRGIIARREAVMR